MNGKGQLILNCPLPFTENAYKLYGLILPYFMLLFCMIIRVSCNVHQRHHDHAEDTAYDQADQESYHNYSLLFDNCGVIMNKYLYSIIPITQYNYTMMLYNTIYSAPKIPIYKIS